MPYLPRSYSRLIRLYFSPTPAKQRTDLSCQIIHFDAGFAPQIVDFSKLSAFQQLSSHSHRISGIKKVTKGVITKL